MLANNWKQNLHLEPEKGWLNDPNGLAYFKGKYHIFHQYSYEVNGGLKLWYYYTSSDLKKYEDRGVFLTPTIEEEKSGVYSGSANIEGDKLVFYYTGNVKYKGDYDYVHAGRGHNTISFSTEDGVNFTEKKCLLTTDDYPNMSNHVRDPKVFEKNGKNYLVLGARDSNDYGCLLVYDKDTLEPYKTIYSEKNLGFMWECPDYFEVDGKEIFMFSPQGISRMYPNFENMYQIGYSVVEEGIENVEKINNFSLLDYGHDFYAAQTFVDEDGDNEELTVLCQTRLAGANYLLVSDAEIEDLEDDDATVDVFIIKEEAVSEDGEDVLYKVVEDEKEILTVSKVFEEMMDDVDFEIDEE